MILHEIADDVLERIGFPDRFNDPFNYIPHPLCNWCWKNVENYVAGQIGWEESLLGGKMFGVLVVRGLDNKIYYLAAHSGQIGNYDTGDFFVPPVFDVNKSEYFQTEMHDIECLHDDFSARKRRSESLQSWLFSQYEFLNGLGELKSLEMIFTDYYRKTMLNKSNYEKNASSHHIPSGSGDCCAPKLLQYAFLHGLNPVCMSEYWYNPVVVSTSCCSVGQINTHEALRRHGMYYPACHSKCRPILSFMLDGLDIDKGLPTIDGISLLDKVSLVYEDHRLLVVDKPSGLLSVPGRNGDFSLSEWLERFHGMNEYYIVHRLDQDTSGLLVIAKDIITYKELQRQFVAHEVQKTYEALVDGVVECDSGKIKVRMRPDPNDRPRQIVDETHGKVSVTRWKVIERLDGQTLVELYPDTGRTHQLRVHCAHPLGLNAPIHGDRLYGTGKIGDRLMLRAKRIEFPSLNLKFTV